MRGIASEIMPHCTLQGRRKRLPGLQVPLHTVPLRSIASPAAPGGASACPGYRSTAVCHTVCAFVADGSRMTGHQRLSTAHAVTHRTPFLTSVLHKPRQLSHHRPYDDARFPLSSSLNAFPTPYGRR
jgi:hypothetical protein